MKWPIIIPFHPKPLLKTSINPIPLFNNAIIIEKKPNNLILYLTLHRFFLSTVKNSKKIMRRTTLNHTAGKSIHLDIGLDNAIATKNKKE